MKSKALPPLALLIGLLLACPVASYASSSPSLLAETAFHEAKTYVDQIHSEVFCLTLACSSNSGQVKIATIVSRDVSKLEHVQRVLAVAVVPSALHPIVSKFAIDSSV